jgi:hypothetical protein
MIFARAFIGEVAAVTRQVGAGLLSRPLAVVGLPGVELAAMPLPAHVRRSHCGHHILLLLMLKTKPPPGVPAAAKRLNRRYYSAASR